MGTLRFLLPESSRVLRDRLELVSYCGLDGMPMRIAIEEEGQELRLLREGDESGKVQVPIQDPTGGILLMPTGTVVQRESPYLLLLEVARGAVDRVRNQHELWERCGFQFSPEIEHSIAAAASSFCEAAVRQQRRPECDAYAERALDEALLAMRHLQRAYAEQVVELRREGGEPLSVLYGFRLPMLGFDEPEWSGVADQPPLESSNSVFLEIDWSRLERHEGGFDFHALRHRIADLHQAGYTVAAGPVLRLDEDLLPNFILDLEQDDFDYLRRRVSVFARELTRAIGSEVEVLEAVGGLNSIADLQMPIEYRLRLAVDVIEGIRRENAEVPLLVGFDQPWCEGSLREHSLSPLQSADAIVRANLDVSGFVLEVNWGLQPSGTLPRDPLQWHHLIDLWSQFDVPLFVSLSIPSCCDEDRQARFDDRCLDEVSSEIGLSRQQDLLERWLDFLLAKPIVQGVFWSQLHDGVPHRYRHAGLLDRAGQAKPALARWLAARARHLQ